MATSTIDWLLEGDPAIRWQTLRDLVGARAAVADRERKRIATEGWGARLLAVQGPAGRWSGYYTPKWTSATYTLLTLRDCGLLTSARVQDACRQLVDSGLQPDGGVNFGSAARRWRKGETCITGMTLSVASYFELDDDRLDTIAEHLLGEQMKDGGWNCRRGSTHSSMNTTISALEGLRNYELSRSRHRRAARLAQQRGREFLLAHRLYRSHRTGVVIKPEFTRLSFPPRWHYDILRALDYFQSVGAPRDERLRDAIDVLLGKQDSSGRWPLQNRYAGKAYFHMERLGPASRWNTLRALRVLKWWNDADYVAATAASPRT